MLAIVIFAVAAPDRGPVLVGRVPCLPAVPSAAVAALDLGAENAGAAVRPAYGFPALDFLLNGLPLVRVDDRLVAVLDIVLRHFALIDFSLLGQKICRKTLLKQCRPAILLVLQDAVHRGCAPLRFPGRARDAISGQFPCNRTDGLSGHEVTVDPANDRCLLRIHHRRVILLWPVIVSEKLFIGQGDLAIGEPLTLAPCDILRNGPGLLLREARHDGQKQLAFAIKGVDVLFFKVDLDTFLLQLPYRHQTVYGVPGETADGLGHDQVHRTCEGVCDHLVEPVAFAGIEAADALIRINLYEFPIGVARDVLRVVINLRLV